MIIDLSNSSVYNLAVEKGKTLNKTFVSEIWSGDSFIGYFDLTKYTSATLIVKSKPNDQSNSLHFSTDDNSIILEINGEFTLQKTAADLINIRNGIYEMVLHSTGETRGFLRGKFIAVDQSTGEIEEDIDTYGRVRIKVKNNIAVSGTTIVEGITGATNGLTLTSGDTIVLGGQLTNDTLIEGNYRLQLGGTTNPLSGLDIFSDFGTSINDAGLSGITLLTSLGGDIKLTANNVTNSTILQEFDNITISSNTPGFGGAKYGADYSPGFTPRSIPDIQFVTGITSQIAAHSGVTLASNGLTKVGNTIKLGGTITGDTYIQGTKHELEFAFDTITGNNSTYSFKNNIADFNVNGADGNTLYQQDQASILLMYQNTNPSSYVNVIDVGDFVEMSATNSSGSVTFQMDANNVDFVDQRAVKKGIEYADNYSTGFTKHSLVDLNYVTAHTSSLVVSVTNGLTKVGNTIKLGGTVTGNTTLAVPNNVSFDIDTINTVSGTCSAGFTGDHVNITAHNTSTDDGTTTLFTPQYFNATAFNYGVFGEHFLNAAKTGSSIGYNKVGLNTSLDVNETLVKVHSAFSGFTGAQYGADYSANYTNRSLVDNEYVTGIAATKVDKTAFNSYTGYSRNAEPIGEIFNVNFSGLTNLNQFNVVQGTAFIGLNSGALTLSGGTGTLASYLTYTGKTTCLEKWKTRVTFVMPNPTTTTFGFTFGTKSINTFDKIDNAIRIAADTNPALGRFYVYSFINGATNQQVNGSFTLLSGHTYTVEMERYKNSVYCKVYENGVEVRTLYSTVYNITTQNTNSWVANIGQPAIWNNGGLMRISNWYFESSAMQNVDVVGLGCSDMVGLYSTTNEQRYVELACRRANLNFEILAGIDHTTADILKLIPEVLLLNPKYVILGCLSNDIAHSVVTGTWQANYTSIVNQLKAAGIQVIHLTPWARNGVTLTAAVNFINTFTSDIIVDVYTLTKDYATINLNNSYDIGDNAHPNVFGNLRVGEVLYSKIKYLK